MSNVVWCSVDSRKLPPALIDADRQFDVIFHNYGDEPFEAKAINIDGANEPKTNCRPKTGVYLIDAPHEEKLLVAARFMPTYLKNYEQFAFLDDDLTIDVETLNRLFMVGEALRLPLYQPALTRKSFCSHLFLQQIPDAVIRKVSFVEIMAPFFSRDALRACLPTFDYNLSGWGLDCYLWPKKVAGECYVIDALPIAHTNPSSRRDRIQRNGKTPAQECQEIANALANLT